jgi:Glycosyltransferase
MKIIHVLFSMLSAGGTETMLIDIINQQSKTAKIFLIIINNEVSEKLIATINDKVEIISLRKRINDKIDLIRTFYKIHKLVRQINPDIIHSHDHNLIPLFFQWRKKTFYTPHILNIPTPYLRFYRKVFAISKAVQEDLKTRANIDALLVYNGIHVDEYLQKESYELAENKTLSIIQLGRLSCKKGQTTAIEAIALLKSKYPLVKIHLDFVGNGEDFEKLDRLVKEKNLSELITFRGVQDRDWVKNNLRQYDLLIQPSLYEGFGLTIIEGLASGLPIIMTDSGGPKEIFDILQAGIIIEPNNPEELAEKIKNIYECYCNSTIKDTHYLLQDRQKLNIFDVKTTAQNYLDNYIKYQPL